MQTEGISYRAAQVYNNQNPACYKLKYPILLAVFDYPRLEDDHRHGVAFSSTLSELINNKVGQTFRLICLCCGMWMIRLPLGLNGRF